MPFATKTDVTFDKTSSPPRVICGDATHDGITLQDLGDAIREWEDDVVNLDVLPTAAGVASILEWEGKAGLGLSRFKPILIVVHAPWVVEAGDHTASPIDLFSFDGGSLISDEEAQDLASPRRPFQSVSGVSAYDRAKAQEGLFINAADIETKQDALQASFDKAEGRDLGEHITDSVTGKVIIRDTVNLRRWEANGWEDVARTIPYRGKGLEVVESLVEVAWS